MNTRLIERARKSPRGFFNSAIVVQETAYDENFAKRKLAESCDVLIKIGMCSGFKDCEHCLLQQSHNKTMLALRDKDEVIRRYNLRMEEIESHQIHRANDNRQITNYKGRHTEVEHY